MASLEGFDANKVDPNVGFDAIPAGEYDVCIVASELKPTSKGDGQYLKLELQVLSGQFQNRKLFDNLNIKNPSAAAQQIALGSLSAICRAVGVMTPKDSAELHNTPMRCVVKVKNDPERGPQNSVSSYKPRQAGPSHFVMGSADEKTEQVVPHGSSPW